MNKDIALPPRRRIAREAIRQSFRKLDPRVMARNPVMFVTEAVSAVTAAHCLLGFARGADDALFTGVISLCLWFTVLFANFAEALAEGHGKAHADALRRMKADTFANLVGEDGKITRVLAASLQKGFVVQVSAGETIPGDGDVIQGIASVDESAVTGESAPVIRESGGDRSAVTGGTLVLTDKILVRIAYEQGKGFLDRVIALVEGSNRGMTPNEISLSILLTGMSLLFLIVTASLERIAVYSGVQISSAALAALFVCLIPTTIAGLLSAVGIAGMNRLVRGNVLALSGRAVEAAGDVSTLLLDKTGTITFGNRQASDFIPVGGHTERELAEAARLASISDETPEGRSIIILAKRLGVRADAASAASTVKNSTFVPFSAQTRMSGVDIGGECIRKGAVDAVEKWVRNRGGNIPDALREEAEKISSSGGTPLAVSRGTEILGVVRLKDIVKGGIRERFAQLRAMGIRTVMITGDNPLTAEAIAREAGVDDFLAQATPEDKLSLIRHEQAKGRMVAMAGDGTNDAPALAQADVGVAMNTGTIAAKEAGNMIDLDSNPTKLLEIVSVGKQLLMTRGALTTFSITNDAAKYFAILPAIFEPRFPALSALNIMRLHSPHSAILSAVIFNALIVALLIPLALRGARYRPVGAGALLRRNLFVYGAGGLITPFIGLKLIDMLLVALGMN